MKKTFLITLSLIFIGAGCSINPQQTTVNSFEDCVAAGNPVMESYPRQCKHNNQTFIETITKENTRNTITKPKQASMIDATLAGQYSQAIIKTNKGDITVEFYGEESPITVSNFLQLAKDGFYNGTTFHRVIKDFMIQGGDPLSKDQDKRQLHGTGGPDYKFEDEFNNKPIVKGSLAMANAGPNTNGSQFFIVTAEATPWLDGKHTNFGQVISGMNVVDTIENSPIDGRDNPIDPIVIESIELK